MKGCWNKNFSFKKNKKIMSKKNLKKSDFKNVPDRKRFSEDVWLVDWLVLVPSGRKHESGYRLINVVAWNWDQPLYKVTGCSDVINLGWIGWYWKSRAYWKLVQPIGWAIDLLPCWYFRIFNTNWKIDVWHALSNFEIFWISQEKILNQK